MSDYVRTAFRPLTLAFLCSMAFVHAASARAGGLPDHAVVGAGVAAIPTYEGSGETRYLPFPVIDIKKGRFFLNVGDGAGVLVVDSAPFVLGGSVALVGGYRGRDVPDGVDRLRFRPGARLFSRIRLGRLALGVGATRSLGGTDGVVADASVSYTIPFTPSLTLIPALNSSYADKRYMDGYFGIDEREARLSGLSPFEPRAGIKNVGASLSSNLSLSKRVNMTGTIGTNRLLNDAVRSPLNRSRWTVTGFLGLSYRL